MAALRVAAVLTLASVLFCGAATFLPRGLVAQQTVKLAGRCRAWSAASASLQQQRDRALAEPPAEAMPALRQPAASGAPQHSKQTVSKDGKGSHKGGGKAKKRSTLAAWQQQQQPEAQVNVVVWTGHWWTKDAAHVLNGEPVRRCCFRRAPLGCRYGPRALIPPGSADAVLFHLPHALYYEVLNTTTRRIDCSYEFPARAHPGQAFIGYTVASSAVRINPFESTPGFLDNFEYMMSYQLASDVYVGNLPFDARKPPPAPLPGFTERTASVAYIASNCNPANPVYNRTEIVAALMREGAAVAAMGKCLQNTPTPAGRGRNNFMRNVELLQHFRVCIAIENSNVRDYVSEKVWFALEAGCVPLYWGAPNARQDFLPAPDSVIWVEDFMPPPGQRREGDYAWVATLAVEVSRVLTDERRYRHYTAWRSRPYESLGAGYRALLALRGRNPWCAMCQLLATRRAAVKLPAQRSTERQQQTGDAWGSSGETTSLM